LRHQCDSAEPVDALTDQGDCRGQKARPVLSFVASRWLRKAWSVHAPRIFRQEMLQPEKASRQPHKRVEANGSSYVSSYLGKVVKLHESTAILALHTPNLVAAPPALERRQESCRASHTLVRSTCKPEDAPRPQPCRNLRSSNVRSVLLQLSAS